jgi:hypothetical protein
MKFSAPNGEVVIFKKDNLAGIVVKRLGDWGRSPSSLDTGGLCNNFSITVSIKGFKMR